MSFKRIKNAIIFVFIILSCMIILSGCEGLAVDFNSDNSGVPQYSGVHTIYINGNVPYFEESDYMTDYYVRYSELDSLGRSGPMFACLDFKHLVQTPTDTSGMDPVGFKQAFYKDLIEGDGHLYDRSHLLAHSMSGDSFNNNCITGTQCLNQIDMVEYEGKVRDYLKYRKDKHVIYRVTPVYENDNLVPDGVLMEASSVEDKGKGLEYCVYIFNVQDGITIDYSDGSSKRTPKRDLFEILQELLNF